MILSDTNVCCCHQKMFPVDFTVGTFWLLRNPEVLEREIRGPLSASNLLEVAAWPGLAGRRSAEVDGIGI